jgi:hypothetical protein
MKAAKPLNRWDEGRSTMNKVLLGLLLGGGLGVLDGLTAWFTPEVRKDILSIVMGSTFKGLVAGLLIGFFAKRVASIPATIAFGVLVSGFFAYLVAAQMGKYYFEVMLPGALVGLVTGYVTSRYGKGGPAGNPEARAA